jgi:hypothetical protein
MSTPLVGHPNDDGVTDGNTGFRHGRRITDLAIIDLLADRLARIGVPLTAISTDTRQRSASRQGGICDCAVTVTASPFNQFQVHLLPRMRFPNLGDDLLALIAGWALGVTGQSNRS